MNFCELFKSDIKKTDEHIATLTVGDRWEDMRLAWGDAHPGRFLFTVGNRLYCRGSKQEKEFAKGFVSGWRQAICIEPEEHEDDNRRSFTDE